MDSFSLHVKLLQLYHQGMRVLAKEKSVSGLVTALRITRASRERELKTQR